VTALKKLVLATGNSSWWKAKKYRRAAADALLSERRGGWRLVSATRSPRRGAETRVFTVYVLRLKSRE